MSKITFAIIGLIALSAVALVAHHSQESSQNLRASGTDYCPSPIYRSDAWMKDFLDTISSFSFDSQVMNYIQTQVPTDSHMFSTEQVLQVFSKIHFDNSQKIAITIMNPYIVSLTGDNIVSILNSFAFSGSKMEALKGIASALVDVSAATKSAIVNTFSFSSDKSAAQAILDAVVARNCLYGTVTETVAAFIIDISGSMDYTFNANGSTITRLSYVKAQLTKTLAEQLKPYQMFNIIVFSNSAAKWKSDYVSATSDNISAAITYINNLKTSGATNISSGLDLAFSTKADLRGIYLLSDGVPNSGITSVAGIQKYLTDKNAARTNKVRVNAISFILGGIEPASERTLSQQFLNAIADSTNGSFKGISQ